MLFHVDFFISLIYFTIFKAGKLTQVASKVIHNPMMKTNIPAGMASSAPPLGTMLGQVYFVININIYTIKHYLNYIF